MSNGDSQLTLFDLSDADSGTTFSPCRTYRYRLWRHWDPLQGRVVWIMLTPSTADELGLGPTIRRCVNFTRRLGYGGVGVLRPDEAAPRLGRAGVRRVARARDVPGLRRPEGDEADRLLVPYRG